MVNNKPHFFKLICALILLLLIILVAYAGKYPLKREQVKITKSQATPFQQEPCWFDNNDSNILAVCGWHRAVGEQLTYRIPVVVLRHRKPVSSATVNSNPVTPALPLVYLGGGPGSGLDLTERGINHWLGWYERHNLQQPLILTDYRSTGLSTPSFECRPYREAYAQSLLDYQSISADELHQTLSNCFTIWDSRGFSSRDFSARDFARDVINITNSLGFNKVNVYGVSYGTRVALELIDTAPELIERLILDSPVNPATAGVNYWPQRLVSGFKHYFEYCNSYSYCDLDKNLLTSYMEQLQNEPVVFDSSHNSQFKKVRVNDGLLVSALYTSFPAMVSTITGPSNAIFHQSQGVDGRVINIDRLIWHYLNSALNHDFNSFVYFASNCADNIGYDNRLYQVIDNRNPLSRYTEFNPSLDICDSLAQQPAQLPSLDKITPPTLILSGFIDAITPPSDARALSRHLSHSYLVQFPHSGHGVTSNSHCACQLVSHFLNNKPLQVDTIEHCVKEQAALISVQ